MDEFVMEYFPEWYEDILMHLRLYQENRKKSRDISLIILTHSHPDHIGAAHEIQRVTGCKVSAHYGDISWIEDVELQNRERPVPDFHSLVGGSVMIDNVSFNIALSAARPFIFS